MPSSRGERPFESQDSRGPAKRKSCASRFPRTMAVRGNVRSSGRDQSRHAWRQFDYVWRPPDSGSYVVLSRATDNRGVHAAGRARVEPGGLRLERNRFGPRQCRGVALTSSIAATAIWGASIASGGVRMATLVAAAALTDVAGTPRRSRRRYATGALHHLPWYGAHRPAATDARRLAARSREDDRVGCRDRPRRAGSAARLSDRVVRRESDEDGGWEATTKVWRCCRLAVRPATIFGCRAAAAERGRLGARAGQDDWVGSGAHGFGKRDARRASCASMR